MTQTDDWSWFDAPQMSDVDLSGHDVTAVVVCRNAASWLNATLAGLGRSDRRPAFVIAIDNESSDDTRDLLDDALEAGLVDEVVTGKARFCFGEAVEHALKHVPRPTRWIWLLHDDAVPDHNALTELLTLAARTPRLAIAVPLLVRPSRRHHAARTLEIGATISGSGRRVLGLETDEVAQGQYESTSVLGGSTCGMLIGWESLRTIGGFDSAILGYRDGVDLGWRAQLDGQWVRTCPTARIVHRQVGRSEIRRATLASQAKRTEAAWDRLMGLRLVAAHSRGLGRLAMLARLTLVCLFSAFIYLLGRAPDHARDEVQAWSDFLFHSRRPVARLRKKVKAVAKRANRDTHYRIRSLRPSLGSVIGEGFQSFARWFHDQFMPTRDAEMTLDDLLGDEFTRRVGEGRKRVPGGVWLVLILAGVALMVRNLYRTGVITAPGLLGAPASLAGAFQTAFSWVGRGEPWLLVSAAFSAVTIKPGWFPVAMFVIAFPATMLVAAWATRHVLRHSGLRWLACAGYALLPILMGGLNRGSLWLVALAITVPFVAQWLSRLTLPWMGARSLQPLAGLALSGVIVIAITPGLWLPVMVLAIVLAAYAGGTARVVRVVVTVCLPIGFWIQAVPNWLREPARLILTPEARLNDPPTTWEMLFARPVSVGVPPLWLSIAVVSVIWLGAIVVVIQGAWRRWVVLAGLVSIGAGMWLGHVSLSLQEDPVFTDASPWLLIGFALILFCFISWIDETLASLEGRDFGGKQALVGLMSLLLALGFVLSAGWSAYAGMESVQRGVNQLPQYLAQAERDLDTATLVLDGGSGAWNLRAQGQTFWGQGTFRSGPLAASDADAMLEQIVARIASGRADDAVAGQLAVYGVSSLVVTHANATLVSALDSAAGFQRTTNDEALEVWRVTVQSDGQASVAPTRRALIAQGSPAVYLSATAPVTADSPRTLVLAAPPDPNMHVYVGGVEAQPVTWSDWRAAYSLGSATGDVQIVWTMIRPWSAWVQLALFVLLIIFAFPPLTESGVSESPRYQMRSSR
ncbi:MAG: glycosyltransferase family 2 protein [Propionibacteriaceae bacterium]|jgi:GT2 family glycosyltransferase|nr:glycosyltransferase family 2 protein [Propionibacteriaceae bacterium]